MSRYTDWPEVKREKERKRWRESYHKRKDKILKRLHDERADKSVAEKRNKSSNANCKKRKITALEYFGGYCYECYEYFNESEIPTIHVQFDHVIGPKLWNPSDQHTTHLYFEEVLIKTEPVHLECHCKRSVKRKQEGLVLTENGWISY